MNINFSEEIEKLEQALEKNRQHLSELEARRATHTVQTSKARIALADLEAVLKGETPPSEKTPRRSTRGVHSLSLHDSGRPSRGARRQQVINICRQLGVGNRIFRTKHVLDVLRDVEDEFTTGMRSYTYALMNALDSEGIIERQGRGKWMWKGNPA